MSFALIQKLLHSPETMEQIDRIMAEAASTPGLVGQDLWRSLATSGVAVGIDSAMSIMRAAGTETMMELREMLLTLSKIITLLDDANDIAMVTKARDMLQKRLVDHAALVRASIMSEATRTYEIEEDDMKAYVAGGMESMMLQQIGHRAFRNRADLFGGWILLTRLGKAQSMKCMCASCVIVAVGRLTQEETKDIGEASDAMLIAMRKYGGLSELYEAYGTHLLDMVQRKIEEAQDGLEPEHELGTAGMTIVSDILKSFSSPRSDS